jgi:hypothetical protein
MNTLSDSARCLGRLNGVTAGMQIILSAQPREACGVGASPRRPGRVEECHSFGWCLVFKGKHHAEGKIMRVFVTGATGALGRHLVPGLVAAGHGVTATTRTPGKVAQLRAAGAEPVILDGLDREAVIATVRAAAPEVIVHEMTALAGMRSFRRVDRVFAATNELRTRGTDNLLAAAERAGTRRVIAQGYAGAGPDKRSGGRLKTEEDPLDWRPIRSAVQGPAAIRHVDKTVPLEAPEGIVLHPGTIQLDGDTATGRAYMQELARTRDGRQGLNYAIYHDRYQRTGDGWKFTERVYEVRYLDTSPLAGSAPRPARAPADPPAGNKAAAEEGR